MKHLMLVVAFALAGCASIPRPDTSTWAPSVRDEANGEVWTPTSEEKIRADQLGRRFAYEDLGLSVSSINKMRSQFTGHFRSGKAVLYIQFYDPEYHRPLASGRIPSVWGGFPRYFTVSVDVEKWTVVEHYASPL